MKKLLSIFALSATALFSAIPTTGLTAYYNFNNNLNDHSGNNKNLTNNGATFTHDRSGNENSAGYFNGTNSRCFYNGTIQTTTHEWAISAWIKTKTTTGGHSVVLTTGNTSTSGYGMVASSNTAAGALWGHSYFGSSGNTFTPETWNHVLIMRKGGTTATYINGVQSGTTITQTPNMPDGFSVGSSIAPTPAEYFKGSIDDIRVYNRALTDGEIAELKNENASTSGGGNSEVVGTKTVWSTDQILTENYTIAAGEILVIEAGVKVLPVFIDGNADTKGDISFTVNGVLISNGTSENPVIFESYDQKTNKQVWQGIVLNGSNQTISHVKVRNCLTGLQVAGTHNTLTHWNVDSLQTGLSITGANTQFQSSAVVGCDSGIVATATTALVLSDLNISENLTIGIALDNISGELSGITAKKNSGIAAIGINGAGNISITYSTIDSNTTDGITIDNITNFYLSQCNIRKNKGYGIYTTPTSDNSVYINNSNIYGNKGEKEKWFNPELSWHGNGTRTLPIPTKVIKVLCNPDNSGSDWYQIAYGSWTSQKHSTYNQSQIFFDTLPEVAPAGASITVWGEGYIQGISSHLSQQGNGSIQLVNTTFDVNARNNWWGQIGGIDSLIFDKTTVDYTGFKTSAITDAGAENYKARISVSPQSLSFNTVPVGYPDTLDVTVSNTGGAPLYIDSLTIEGTSFSVFNGVSSILGGTSQVLKVVFDPATATPYNAYLNIYSSDKDATLSQVLLTGTGIPYNYKPEFIGKPTDTLTIAGELFNRTISAIDQNGVADTLSFSLLDAPTGMDINAQTGVISWQSPISAISNSVVIRVADMQGLADTTSFQLTVNHRPTFLGTLPTHKTMPWGQTYTYDVNAHDADGHSLSYYLDSRVGNMIMSLSSGLMNYTAIKGDIGVHPIQIRVVDALGADVVHTFMLTVTDTGKVTQANIGISIAAHRFDSVAVNETVFLPVIISNSGDGTLVLDSVVVGEHFAGTYKNREVPAGSSDTLMLSFSPTALQAYQDTLILYNNDPTTSLLKLPLSGTVVNKNTAPYITVGYPDTLIAPETLLSLSVIADDDTPGDTLYYDLIGGSDYAELDSLTGEFTWQTVSNTTTDTFVVRISDRYAVSVLDTFIVTIDKLLVLGSIGSKTVGDATFALSTAGGSGTGAVTYASSNTAVISISGTAATVVGAGTATITATKAASTGYHLTTADEVVVVSAAAPVMYAVTLSAGAHGSILPKTVANVVAGGTLANITATADDGYIFLNWTVGKTVIGTAKTLTGYVITGAVTITANFDKMSALDVVDAPKYEVSQMVISPNPVSRSAGEVTIYFPQNIIGTGSCTIYDAQGNRIDHQDVNLARGTAIRWDLCNESGRRVASGGYLAVLQITDSMGMVHFAKSMVGVSQ